MRAPPPAVVLGLGGIAAAVLLLGAAATPPGRGAVRLASDRVGRFFTWADLTVSAVARRLGLDNTPTAEASRSLAVLVAYTLDPLQAALGQRITITSAFRSPEVNTAIDGSPTSQHMLGEAVDFVVPGYSAEQLARFIVRSRLPFDQLIWYAPERGGHVHVSLTTRRPNRGQTLYAPLGEKYVAWPARL